MAKILDKLVECASRMEHCQKLFMRPPHEVKSSMPMMCRRCRDDAHVTLVAYFNRDVTVEALRLGVRVTKGFMLARSSGVIQLVAQHMNNFDDDEFAAWWKTNVVGPELDPQYPSIRQFINQVVREYANMQPTRDPNAMTSNIGARMDAAPQRGNRRPNPRTAGKQNVSEGNPGTIPESKPAEPIMAPAEGPATSEGDAPTIKRPQQSDASETAVPRSAVASVVQDPEPEVSEDVKSEDLELTE